MTDDERVRALQDALMDAVNASRLPLSVKALTLENLLLRIHAAMAPGVEAEKKEETTE